MKNSVVKWHVYKLESATERKRKRVKPLGSARDEDHLACSADVTAHPHSSTAPVTGCQVTSYHHHLHLEITFTVLSSSAISLTSGARKPEHEERQSLERGKKVTGRVHRQQSDNWKMAAFHPNKNRVLCFVLNALNTYIF